MKHVILEQLVIQYTMNHSNSMIKLKNNTGIIISI